MVSYHALYPQRGRLQSRCSQHECDSEESTFCCLECLRQEPQLLRMKESFNLESVFPEHGTALTGRQVMPNSRERKILASRS